jgi:hypothetical protein
MEEVDRVEVLEAAVPGRLLGAILFDGAQALAGLGVPDHEAREAREHVRALGVGDRGHERDREQPVEHQIPWRTVVRPPSPNPNPM